MGYEYLDGVAVADVAFRAEGKTVGELFSAACDATTGAMLENLNDLSATTRRGLSLSADTLEMLLFKFLQEVIYLKDAEGLLLRLESVEVEPGHGQAGAGAPGGFGESTLKGVLAGEPIDPARHRLVVDVKAVTLHRFSVSATPSGWQAVVVLDV